MAHRDVEDRVLDIYRRVSPSKTSLETSEKASSFYQTRINILETLGLPSQFFKGRKIIDIGGGTGEKSVCYSLWGAEVTIVEPNEISCGLAEKLFSRLGLRDKLEVVNKSLFEFEMSRLKEFDIVICEAVLHHTYDPIKGLDIILKNMRKGQIVLIALGEKHGTYKRDLQRKLVSTLAGSDEKKTIELAKKYFREHIDRAMKYILRNEDAVIYDTFVNPQDQPSSLEDVCNTFKKNGIRHLSSYPKLDLFYLTRPWSQKRVDFFDYEYYRNYYKFLQKVWMTCGEEDLEKDLMEFDLTNISKRVEDDAEKLTQLDRKITDKNFTEEDLKIIQKGYMGVGANFFVGHKPDEKFEDNFKRSFDVA